MAVRATLLPHSSTRWHVCHFRLNVVSRRNPKFTVYIIESDCLDIIADNHLAPSILLSIQELIFIPTLKLCVQPHILMP